MTKDEQKAKAAARHKRRWVNPEYRARHKARQKALRADPKYRAAENAKNRARQKALRIDPSYRAAEVARNKRNYTITKAKVMEKYGGACIACGSVSIHELCIDHINDDGNEERRQLDGIRGQQFYCKLLRDPKRSDLQVLCFNHNHLKRILGPDIASWPKEQLTVEKALAMEGNDTQDSK